ncbi:hypothetical protein [Streptomyces sp. NPDC048272]|uniref:hypothetical protein n=1 Tax=Streptomyces sp. NPDC048272 TaxID=3154616 RepID=UPI003415D9C9
MSGAVLVLDAGSSSLHLVVLDEADRVVARRDFDEATDEGVAAELEEFLGACPRIAACGHRVGVRAPTAHHPPGRRLFGLRRAWGPQCGHSRSGSIDPGMLLWLQNETGDGPQRLYDVPMRESGLLGLSGTSGDTRELVRAREPGGARPGQPGGGEGARSRRAHRRGSADRPRNPGPA